MTGSLRYWAVIALFTVTVVVAFRRGNTDRVPPSTPLGDMPRTIDSLRGEDYPIPQEALDLLGQGSFLNRIYEPASSAPLTEGAPRASRPVGLFIGYFPTQRTGQSIHSPQNCLPGAGWAFESSGVAEIETADGRTREVGDYLISNGTSEDEVLYWYQSHGRTIANDYLAKFYMLVDAIRYGRTDAALVRIVVPLSGKEDRQGAHRRAVEFATKLLPLLPSYVPN